MTEEARQRIEELHKDKRGVLLRNYLLIFTSTATLLMALVLWSVLSEQGKAITVYVEEAQETVKVACKAAEGEPLPADVQQSCDAAERNEFPSVLQSVVEGPQGDPGATGPRGPSGPTGPTGSTGPPGPTGPIGPEGSSGADGTDGAAGADGAQGEIGPTGPQGPEGPQGPQGPQGPSGTSCPGGYSLREFHWYGRDGVDGTGDEQDWLICVKD